MDEAVRHLVHRVIDDRTIDVRRRVVAATLLPRLRDLRGDLDPLDVIRLSDLPQARALRLQLDILSGVTRSRTACMS